MHKIKTFWAFIGTEKDGTEGVPAFYDQGLNMMMPLVGSDQARIDSLRSMAQLIADQTGQSLELRQFSEYRVVETIKPRRSVNAH